MEDIQYLESQKIILLKWLKGMPSSRKKNIKNILSVNCGNGLLDKEVSKLMTNLEQYNIIQSDYTQYSNCIENLYGDFKFKLSYSELFDYEMENYIKFDLVIFFDGIDEGNIFMESCINMMNPDGKIWIFTSEHKGIITKIKKELKLNINNDRTLISKLEKPCKIFNTHISTYLNINNINTIQLSQLLKKECSENDLTLFKNIVSEEFGEFISVPIAVIILSEFNKR